MMACQFIRWTQPRQMITSGSLGTMGFGLPAAIGAQVALPDKTVLLIDGTRHHRNLGWPRAPAPKRSPPLSSSDGPRLPLLCHPSDMATAAR